MNHSVQLLPSEKTFECEPDESVLTAALRAGLILPYGCKNGACGSCKAELIEGDVDYGDYQPRAMSEDERTHGKKVLTCCAKPLSKVTVKVREITGVGDIPIKKMPCRVQAIERPADDVAIIKLQLPANEVLQFNAGQYIEFLLRDGSRRSYSMANAPYQEGGLELHIRHMPGGVFTDHVFQAMKPREILRMEGPMGTFFLREDKRPAILLASGTGFAPIKSLLEQAFFKGDERDFVLYWGGRKKADLYQMELAKSWEREHTNFRFVPVLSEPTEACEWQGREGFVHQAVMDDFPNMEGYQVYACGAPIVIESAQRDFTAQCKLSEADFFADSFTSLADVA